MIQRIDITQNTIFRVIIILVALFFLYFIRDILVILFTSIIIASAVEPAVQRLKKFKIPRVVTVMFVYLAALGILTLVISLLIPPLTEQIKGLGEDLPRIIEDYSSSFTTVKNLSEQYQVFSSPELFLEKFGERLGQFSAGVFATTRGIIGGFGAVFIILVISFYLAMEEGGIKKFIRAVTPKEHEGYAMDLFDRSQHQIGRWLQGQLALALVVGVLVYIGLSILGVKYALVLALVAAVLEIIPYVGPILAAIPAVILGFIQSLTIGLLVIGLYVIIQQMENHLLQPKIMEKAVGLHPVTVIVVLLIGAKVAGITGMILAVPLTSVIGVFISDLINFSKPTKNGADEIAELESPQ